MTLFDGNCQYSSPIHIRGAMQQTACLAFAFCSLVLPVLVQAADGLSPQPEQKKNARTDDHNSIRLSNKLASILNDESLRSQAIQEGKKASFFCINCHGVDGNSKFMDVPNLAGQNPSYLLTQMLKLSHGERRNAFMERLVKQLSGDELVSISIYYASTAVRQKNALNTAQVAAGKTLFLNKCQECHRPSARGDGDVPRLAGQNPEYLSVSLKRYRAGSGERTNQKMQTVAKQLTNEQIDTLAVYLSVQ